MRPGSVQFSDVTLRDGQQSIAATRMTTALLDSVVTARGGSPSAEASDVPRVRQHLPALHWPLGGVVQAKERSVACGQEEGVRQVGHVQGGLT